MKLLKQLTSLRLVLSALFAFALFSAGPAAAQEYDEGAFYDQGLNWFDDTRGEAGTYGYGYAEGGLYGDEWATDEYGYYDSEYEWTTEEGWFSNWYGEADEGWF